MVGVAFFEGGGAVFGGGFGLGGGYGVGLGFELGFGFGVGGEDGLQFGEDGGVFGGEVLGFEGVGLVVVEFEFGIGDRSAGFFPFDHAVAGGADGAAEEVVAGVDVDDAVAGFGGGVGEDGGEAFAVEAFAGGEAGEFDQGGVDVDGFDEGGGFGVLSFAGGGDDEGDAGGLLVVGVFAPEAVVAEVPAVVAPEDDDGVGGEGGGVQGVEDEAELGVHVGGGGIVAVDEAAGGGVVDVAFFGHVAVLAEFAAELAGVVGGVSGGLGDLGHGDVGAVVEVPVFLGGDEGEVGADEADGEEEGVGGYLGGGLEAFDGFEGDLAVGVEGVFGGGVFGGGSAVAVVAGAFVLVGFGEGVGGGFGGPVRDGPGGGVFAVAVALMEDFAHGFGAVAVLFEVLGEGDGVGGGFAEVGGEVVDAEGLGAQAGHEGVARGGADGLVGVGGLEEEAAFGEAVDVGGFGEGIAEGGDGGFEVVDADEEDVGLGGGALEEEGGGEEGGEAGGHAGGRTWVGAGSVRGVWG